MPAQALRLITMFATIVVFPASAQCWEVSPVSADFVRAKADQSAKARREFDAVSLQALLMPMMASKGSGPTGSGSAGRYWQSLMSEHLARHLAASNQLSLNRGVVRGQRQALTTVPTFAAPCRPRECVPSGAWVATVEYEPSAP